MNSKTPFGVRKSMTGLAFAVGAFAAIPAALAQTYARPYYDPVRDVMVTPRQSTTTPVVSSRTYASPSPVVSSPGAVGVTREPMYGTAYGPPPTARQFYGTGYAQTSTSSGTAVIPSPVPGIQAVPGSRAGLEQQPTAGISPSAGTTAGTVSPTAQSQGYATTRTYVSANEAMPQPYYDPARDVMVTPSQSGTVRYIGAPADPRYAMAQAPDSTFEFVVRNGRLVDGPVQMTVDHGSEVTMVVDSNMADALRIDGYDLVAPIAPNQPMLLKFVAERPGRFAYRLSSGREIGVLEVGPPQPAANRVGMR
jgi:hypothetical protein